MKSVKSKNSYLFIHGGPGLNSFPEAVLLAPLLQERGVSVDFWNEPSRFRKQGQLYAPKHAFRNMLQSAERRLQELAVDAPVNLIAHSFGCNTATILALQNPGLVNEINLVSPTFSLLESHRNIIRLAQEDLKNHSPSLSSKLDILLRESDGEFDEAIQEGLKLAFQDPSLLSHYWKNKEWMLRALECFAVPEAQVDLDSFFEVTQDFVNEWQGIVLNGKVSIPTKVYFGYDDPICEKKLESEIVKKLFSNPRILGIPEVSHYLHLDRPETLLEYLL